MAEDEEDVAPTAAAAPVVVDPTEFIAGEHDQDEGDDDDVNVEATSSPSKEDDDDDEDYLESSALGKRRKRRLDDNRVMARYMKVECHLCSSILLKKNMHRHLRTQHYFHDLPGKEFLPSSDSDGASSNSST